MSEVTLLSLLGQVDRGLQHAVRRNLDKRNLARLEQLKAEHATRSAQSVEENNGW